MKFLNPGQIGGHFASRVLLYGTRHLSNSYNSEAFSCKIWLSVQFVLHASLQCIRKLVFQYTFFVDVEMYLLSSTLSSLQKFRTGNFLTMIFFVNIENRDFKILKIAHSLIRQREKSKHLILNLFAW